MVCLMTSIWSGHASQAIGAWQEQGRIGTCCSKQTLDGKGVNIREVVLGGICWTLNMEQ